MDDDQLEDFVEAVVRGNALAADRALPIESITADQLRQLYEQIGEHYMRMRDLESRLTLVQDELP